MYQRRSELNEKYFDRLQWDMDKEQTFSFSNEFLHIEEIAGEKIIGRVQVLITLDEFSIRVRQTFHPEGSDPNDYYDSNFRPIYRELFTALDDAWSGGWKFEENEHES